MTLQRPAKLPATVSSSAPAKTLLRFITCGSVDDGKSTLIGRLLYDAGTLAEDQVATLVKDSRKAGRAEGDLDFSFLLDGLSAEREQGITIDVACAISPPRGAASSSPTRPATSSTRATWPPARRSPIWR